LIGLVLFPENEIGRLPEGAQAWMETLVQDGRALRIDENGLRYWVAVEALNLLPFGRQLPDANSADQNPLVPVVRGWVEVNGPTTAAGLSKILGFPVDDMYGALIHLEGEGSVLRGFFSGKSEEEFCDRRILARIHRATIVRLRREIEPVSPATFLRFLFEWQHVASGSQLSGEQGVLEVVDQLQGFETAAGAWESEILWARASDYRPEFLDSLCLGGDVVWGRWRHRATQAEVPARRPGVNRSATLGLAIREDMPSLLDPVPPDEEALSVPARHILEFLRRRGASFFPEISSGTKHLPSEVEEALWQLVAAGLVTADSFAALRSLVSGEAKRQEHSRHRRKQPRRTREGRWSLLLGNPVSAEERLEFWAQLYVRRYGVLCRELLARESSAPPWRDLLRHLRRSEARGEIRGGRFIGGLNGEQFAVPDAIDALRAQRRREPQGEYVRISACDPLNLVGILTPGARIPAILGNRIIYRDGVPAAAMENEQIRMLSLVEAAERARLDRLLDVRPPAKMLDSRM
jgi:ATP-dependent Lhr-like helicase